MSEPFPTIRFRVRSPDTTETFTCSIETTFDELFMEFRKKFLLTPPFELSKVHPPLVIEADSTDPIGAYIEDGESLLLTRFVFGLSSILLLALSNPSPLPETKPDSTKTIQSQHTERKDDWASTTIYNGLLRLLSVLFFCDHLS